MKKQPLIIMISFFTAAIVATGAFAAKSLLCLNVARSEMQNGFTASLDAVTDGTERLSISLNKARNAVTDGFFITSLCEVKSAAEGIISALDMLPEKNECSLLIVSEVAKIADYADALIQKTANGREVSDSELEVLSSLTEGVGLLDESFKGLKRSIKGGKTDLSELFAFSECSYPDGAVSYSDTVSGWKEGLSEFPVLNYDGKYSDHLKNAELLFLKGKEPMEASSLHSAAAELFELSEEELSDPLSREGEKNLCYLHGGVSAEFSESGYLISYISECEKGKATVSPSEAEKTAKEFAKKYGYEDLETSLSRTEGKIAVFELIPAENGVYCYGDCVKVGVSLTSGKVVSFFAGDYVKNHDGISLDFPHTEEEAAALLSDFDIISSKKAVITTAGGVKAPCYEFKVRAKNTAYGNGEHELLIYINAEDLAQEETVVLYETENGSFMIK